MLDPEAPIEREDSVASTKNMFKATFGEISKYNCLVVVILPFRVPDNLCHFAAQEATMVIDQFLKPDFEEQINRTADEQAQGHDDQGTRMKLAASKAHWRTAIG